VGGDPNVKSVRLSLATEEWRKLRAWAAAEDLGVHELIVRILRRELERRPRLGP